MPKPVCVKCEVEFRLEKVGVVVAETFQRDTEIYKVWEADKWKCPKCGIEIVFGFADRPLKQHFDGDIDKLLLDLQEKGKEIIYTDFEKTRNWLILVKRR